MSAYFNIAQVAANMSVLGYGNNRAGVWTQGCAVNCPGCSSLHTHDPKMGRRMEVGNIIDWLLAQPRPVTGLTLSGGEPSEQSKGVLALINAFREAFAQADVLMFSGLPWQRLIKHHKELVSACDVVIAGPYIQHLPPLPLRGSSNQTVHLLTDLARERYHDLDQWPVHSTQVAFGYEKITTVGIPDIPTLSTKLCGNSSFDANTASWIKQPKHENGANQ
jgi:anaerobic ribonucleoside-triphosphate reductase activating protein